ncbi:MAG TPA: trigger factor, partial [Limnochordia bacterium]
MKATVERLKGSRIRLDLEVDPDRVEQALERAYRRVVRRIDVPGFRKGRAPRPIVERQIGAGALLREALDELIPVAVGEAVREAELEPLEQPNVDVKPFERGKPLSLTAELTVKPAVELGQYRGLTAVRRIERVSDSQIDQALERIRERAAELVEADHDAVAEGDFAVIDFEGFVDGQPFRGGAARGETVRVGSGRFVPGFEEQLIGLKKGEQRRIEVTFPSDFRNPELAGRAATFKVTLHAIKVQRLPALDDEFAASVSECETIADLRRKIREDLEREAARRADEAVQLELARQAARGATIEVPEVLVEREIDEMLIGLARDLAARGQSLDDVLNRTGEGLAELRQRMRPNAEERVRIDLVLEAIGRAEGIAPTEAELQAEINRLVETAEDRRAARAQMEAPERREAVRRTLMMRRALQLLVDTAQLSDEWVDPAPGD